MISSHHAARRFGFAATLLIGLVAGTAALADGIPQEDLDANNQSCVTACTARAQMSADNCAKFCGCEVKYMNQYFSRDEYTAMTAAIRQKQQPTQASIDKMTTIAKACKSGLQ